MLSNWYWPFVSDGWNILGEEGRGCGESSDIVGATRMGMKTSWS